MKVSYLLDTCTLIWLVNGAADLSLPARAACREAGANVCVSAISAVNAERQC